MPDRERKRVPNDRSDILKRSERMYIILRLFFSPLSLLWHTILNSFFFQSLSITVVAWLPNSLSLSRHSWWHLILRLFFSPSLSQLWRSYPTLSPFLCLITVATQGYISTFCSFFAPNPPPQPLFFYFVAPVCLFVF